MKNIKTAAAELAAAELAAAELAAAELAAAAVGEWDAELSTTNTGTSLVVYLSDAELLTVFHDLVVDSGNAKRAKSGTWSSVANTFARKFTDSRPGYGDAVIAEAYKAQFTALLDSSISNDKKNPDRLSGKSMLSAALKKLRDSDKDSRYLWPAKKVKIANVARDAIEAWVKTAGESELVACVALLPKVTAEVMTARKNALASLTAEQRTALGL